MYGSVLPAQTGEGRGGSIGVSGRRELELAVHKLDNTGLSGRRSTARETKHKNKRKKKENKNETE
jgi:hypothetical protein